MLDQARGSGHDGAPASAAGSVTMAQRAAATASERPPMTRTVSRLAPPAISTTALSLVRRRSKDLAEAERGQDLWDDDEELEDPRVDTGLPGWQGAGKDGVQHGPALSPRACEEDAHRRVYM